MMAPSPTRSTLNNDDNVINSPEEKKIKLEDHCLMKMHKVYKDEGSIHRGSDNFNDELRKKKDIKRKRSRSPLQEPSSSKHYIESTSKDKLRSTSHTYIDADEHSEYRRHNSKADRGKSPRPCFVDKNVISEAPNAASDKYKKGFGSRSKSPSSNNWNERYTRPLPPGAKGKL